VIALGGTLSAFFSLHVMVGPAHLCDQPGDSSVGSRVRFQSKGNSFAGLGCKEYRGLHITIDSQQDVPLSFPCITEHLGGRKKRSHIALARV
jgi:hypothetical protein